MTDTTPEKQHALKQAEETLRQSEQHISSVWEYISDAMALSTPDGTVIAANSAYFHLYGYTPEEVVGKPYSIIFPREQRKSAQEVYDYVFQSPVISSSFEVTIIRADGTERFVESSYNFVTHNGTRIAMISVIRDITARKRAEEDLRVSKLKLHLALEIGHLLSWDWDIKSDTIRWPAHSEAPFGPVPGSSHVSYATFLELIHPQDRVQVDQEVKRVLEEGNDYKMEFRVILPDGTIRRTRTHGEVLYNEAGKPIRMIGITMDIT